jgi:transcriptional regulator with XRE-family HTH domain
MKDYQDDFSKTIEKMAENDSKFKREWEILDKVEKLIDELVAERKRQKLSQRDLAKLSGLKQEAIARMETMQAVPRLDTFVKIAKALNHELTFRDAEIRKAIDEFALQLDDMFDRHMYTTTAIQTTTYENAQLMELVQGRNYEDTKHDAHNQPCFVA